MVNIKLDNHHKTHAKRVWMLYCPVSVMLPQSENISCWKLRMIKLCIYFLKIATWNYDKYLTGCSSEWNYLYPGRKGSDMASSQTQGVPDCTALIELPWASIRADGSIWAPCGWSQCTVVSWARQTFLGTKAGIVSSKPSLQRGNLIPLMKQ